MNKNQIILLLSLFMSIGVIAYYFQPEQTDYEKKLYHNLKEFYTGRIIEKRFPNTIILSDNTLIKIKPDKFKNLTIKDSIVKDSNTVYIYCYRDFKFLTKFDNFNP